MPPQDGAGSDDEPQPGEALDRQRPGQQRQPRPIRPRQPRMSPWLLAQGDSQLMAQDQDLGVLPPHLPPGQAQQRHGAGDDEEDQFQAHKPKIIARTARCRPAHRPPGAGPERRRFPANLPRWQRFSAPTRVRGSGYEARSMPFWFVFAVCLASTVTVAGRVTLSGTLEIAVRNALLGLRRPAAR